MLALGITRFRVGLLLVALALGMGGQAASAGALAAQTAAAEIAGMTSGSACADCGTEHQNCTFSPGCAYSVCSSFPALPAQSGAFAPPSRQYSARRSS